MEAIWKNRFIAGQILLLVMLKLALSQPVSGLIGLAGNVAVYSGSEIIAETNHFRVGIGLPTLQENPLLNKAASDKLTDMIANQYFAHISPSGIDPWYWLIKNSYSYSAAGENLAIGFFDAHETVQAWIDSPSHKNNLADMRFREIGVATGKTTIGNLEGIVVVQMFGRPTEQKPTQATTTLTPLPSTPHSPDPTLKGAPVSLTYVQTSPAASPQPSVEDIALSTGKTENGKIVLLLNNIFIVYAGLISIISVLLLIRVSSRRELWLRTLIHVTIFLVALFAPPLIYAGTALIL